MESYLLTHEDPIQSEYERLIASEEYQHYSEYRSKIDQRSSEPLEDVNNQIAAARVDLGEVKKRREEAQQTGAQTNTLVRLRLLMWILITASLVLEVLFGINIINVGQPEKFIAMGAFLLVIVGSVLTGVLLTGRIRDRDRAARSSQLDHDVAVKALELRMKSSIKEVVTLAINDILGPEGKLAFPTEAPRLIELNTSEVVPSRSSDTLRRFIKGHSSSAIGIAGPRGSGKSALMRGLIDDSSLDPLVVLVNAPVKYDAADFVRSLYLDVAKLVTGEAESAKPSFREIQRKRQRRSRLLLTTLLVYVGLLMVMYDFMSGSALLPFDALGPITVSGIVFVLIGIYVMVTYGTAARPEMKISKIDFSEKNISLTLAHLAINELTYEIETNSRNKNAASILGGQIAIEDESSVTQKSRLKSHPQLVKELRNLLGAFASDQSPRPVIVMIDELDKISATSDLIDTVNGLKDLFHIDGVHFVVSVSTDALLNFEQRGLPSRDAFDSSFDSIFSVQRLSLDESLRVLSARSTGFPPTVGAFCHAWTGGLPRDLLRAARSCVEIQRSEGHALSMSAFVRMIVAKELATLAEGTLGARELSATDRRILINVRSRAQALLSERGDLSHAPLPTVHADRAFPSDSSETIVGSARESTATSPDSRVETIVMMTRLGEALVKYVSHTELEQSSQWVSSDQTKILFESSAHAMSLRGASREIAVEAFAEAMKVIESS